MPIYNRDEPGEQWLDDEDEDDEDDEKPQPPHGLRYGEGQKRGRGRPRGSPNRATIIKRVAKKRHKIKLDRKLRSVDTLYLVMATVRTQASRGNLPAFILQEKLKAQFTPATQVGQIAVLAVGSEITIEEWEAVYGLPRIPEDEALARFPHLYFLIKKRGPVPVEAWLSDTTPT